MARTMDDAVEQDAPVQDAPAVDWQSLHDKLDALSEKLNQYFGGGSGAQEGGGGGASEGGKGAGLASPLPQGPDNSDDYSAGVDDADTARGGASGRGQNPAPYNTKPGGRPVTFDTMGNAPGWKPPAATGNSAPTGNNDYLGRPYAPGAQGPVNYGAPDYLGAPYTPGAQGPVNPGYTAWQEAGKPSAQGQSGGSGNGAARDGMGGFDANNPADKQWWVDFMRAHQGTDPVEYYSRPENAKPGLTPLEAAMADRGWGNQMGAALERPLTYYDWVQHYNVGGGNRGFMPFNANDVRNYVRNANTGPFGGGGGEPAPAAGATAGPALGNFPAGWTSYGLDKALADALAARKGKAVANA